MPLFFGGVIYPTISMHYLGDAVARGTAAEHAGRLSGEVRIAQLLPLRRFIERLDHGGRRTLASDAEPHEPGDRHEEQREQLAERGRGFPHGATVADDEKPSKPFRGKAFPQPPKRAVPATPSSGGTPQRPVRVTKEDEASNVLLTQLATW